jgi:hypothetical protein
MTLTGIAFSFGAHKCSASGSARCRAEARHQVLASGAIRFYGSMRSADPPFFASEQQQRPKTAVTGSPVTNRRSNVGKVEVAASGTQNGRIEY